MKPLVSIIIPAYNAEEWIASTLQSAIAQTWQRNEIIVVDDESTDRTGDIARRFASKSVVVLSKQNEGAAAARNHGFSFSQGDYIQWLDADDVLAPDKIETQLAALREGIDDYRTLLSCAWASFDHQIERATFTPTSLWHDLSPIDWLTRRMSENLYMQTATWLTSRELTNAAGPWNPRLLSDDDVEYFCRVVLMSNGTRFVPEAKVYYRNSPSLNRLSYIGTSDEKKDALLLSLKLQVQRLRSIDNGELSRKACLTYLQHSSAHFCPGRPDILVELQDLASNLRSSHPKSGK